MLRSFLSLSKLTAIPVSALLALATSAQVARAQVGTGSVGVPPLLGSHTKVGATSMIGSQTKVEATPLLTVAQIVAGELTIDEAWKQKLLSTSIVIELLEKRESLAAGRTNLNLRRDLAGSLVRYAPQIVEDPTKLDARVRLELGRYYSGQGDIKAVALCETLIREKLEGHEQNQPQGSAAEPEDVGSWLHSISLLAKYYENVNQWQKAGETWERGLAFRKNAGWWHESVRIEAARAYTKANQPQKARALYLTVEQTGNTKFRGMAFYDQASALIEDHPAQARDLVLNALPLLTQPIERIGPLWALSQAQWKLEDWKAAEATLVEMIRDCASLPPSNDGTDILEAAAKSRLATLQKWKNKSLELPLRKLLGRPDSQGIYHATFYVHSFRPQTIEVRFVDADAKLVALTSKRQTRADSGVMVSVYDLSYTAVHPDAPVKAQVSLKDKPKNVQKIELHTDQ